MNPNRLIGDVKLDEGLRLGPDYRPPELKTHFAYPDDGGSFATAIERCFGMAKCRNLGSLTMCPSFHATREERHSTRGRSRLLFEMLKGDPVTDGWRDEAVKESLDLCLSCKGCTGDCPVQVDIPTYKAEFLAHYYAKRRRPLPPLRARACCPGGGRSRRARRGWSTRSATRRRSPGRPSGCSGSPRSASRPSSRARRSADWFAERTGRAPRRCRAAAERRTQRVVLWPDTFTDLFEPDAGKAAVEVLEAAGFAVELPRKHVCCGRPLYDFGMLSLAKRTLRHTLDDAVRADRVGRAGARARAELRVGVPRRAPQADAPRRARPAARAPRPSCSTSCSTATRPTGTPPSVEPARADPRPLPPQGGDPGRQGRDLLTRAGVEAEMTKAGCCGMAGSFGYGAGEQYDVSMRIGEQFLLPAVRAADAEHTAGSGRFLVPDPDHRRHRPARAPHRRGAADRTANACVNDRAAG